MTSLLNSSFSVAELLNSSFYLLTFFLSMVRSFFFWDRNTDAARRDKREETGGALSAIHQCCDSYSFSLAWNRERT
jgi:hypothetical protein